MDANERILAIIPARSGSKGLPDKNILNLHGKPLLAYTIEVALESGVCDDVIVSTDSEKYACISKQYGAQVPFLRSSLTSSDEASSWDAVKEVIFRLEAEGVLHKTLLLLQPTSPLRTKTDIIKALEMYKEKSAKAVVSVCETEHSPLWSNTLDDTMSLDGFINSDLLKRRQELKTFYRINGAIYIVDINFLKEQKNEVNVFEKNCYAYIMPKERSVDIDDATDFYYAQIMLSGKNNLIKSF